MQIPLPLHFHPHRNRGLFSDHYLNDPARLQAFDEWKQAIGLDEAFKEIGHLYARRASRFNARTNEAQTENDFIRPALNLLWGTDSYQVQVPIPNVNAGRIPDYAFFHSPDDRQAAEPRKGALDYWRDTPCLGDAKRWTASLDRERGRAVERDLMGAFGEVENPSAQVCNYLYRSRVRWGILTNGRIWRLYERERSSAGGVYYEVNLEELIQSGDPEAFKYFYLFFRREAFLPDADGVSFVERVFQGSVDHATEVGDRLNESVYDALRLLMNGLLEHPSNGLDRRDPTALKEVHENALILLYRLLFLLYAEDRGLLPRNTRPYADYSLYRLQGEINRRLREGGTYPPVGRHIWGDLTALFGLIDEGYPEGRIPAYNGGLFSPSHHPHIAHTPQPGVKRWEIGDHRLSEVVDTLAYQRERWNEPGTQDIDYNTLDVQHLGSIYEGLLELQPRVADEPMIEVIEGGRPVFKLSREVSNPRLVRGQPPRTVEAGEVYLVTNRGERKATGSYYTPKYIVDYIVENTLGPLVDEAAQKVADLRPEVDKEIRRLGRKRREWEKAREDRMMERQAAKDQEGRLTAQIEAQKRRLLEPYLSLKILDPAMGSGHFLVGAADFLSLAMATDPNLLPLDEMGEEDPQAFCKRLVVERCLYGVDLNPLAVELAKLSLWLHTVSRDRALSFLDHHLRCGNSLIGARLEDDLTREPPRFNARGKRVNADSPQIVIGFTETLTAKHLQHFLGTFREIVEMRGSDAEAERRKDDLYRTMDATRDRFRAVANGWLAPYFGALVMPEEYQQAVNALRGATADWKALTKKAWFQNAQAVARDRRLFHWELEFPEIFFDAHGFKPEKERGFDAVIGNPPYGAEFSQNEKDYFTANSVYSRGKPESYIFFLESGLTLAHKWVGFIVPETFLSSYYGEQVRQWLLQKAFFQHLISLTSDVFPDANVDTCIFIYQNRNAALPYPECLVGSVGKTAKLVEEFHDKNKWRFYEFVEQGYFGDGSDPIGLLEHPQKVRLFNRFQSMSVPLSEIADLSQGIIVYKTKADQTKGYIGTKPLGPEWKPSVGGSDLERYLIVPDGTYVKYGDWLWCPRDHKYFESEKLLFQRIRNPALNTKLVFAYDNQKLYNRHTLSNLILLPNASADIHYLLVLLNSRLLNEIYRTRFSDLEIRLSSVKTLPIRRIAFTTPERERARLLEKGKKLHERCLSKSDHECVLGFVEHELSQTPEHADVVHDLLAFLAELMIEMNRQKQEEVKGFLAWLERAVGAKVDDLSNKTRIRDYHEHDLEGLFDVLRQNRRKLKADPETRSVQENVEREFHQSTTKLAPLKERLNATDRLIDLIVYRLYGLTEEEIAIVVGRK